MKKLIAFLFLAVSIGSAGFVAASESADLTMTKQAPMSEILGLEIDESEKDNFESDASTLASQPLPYSLKTASLPRLEISQLQLVIYYQSGIRAPPSAQ